MVKITKRAFDSRQARYFIHFIGVVAKVCMPKYDMYEVGQLKVKQGQWVGTHHVAIQWGKFFRKYEKVSGERGAN